jgi:plastocyanin
MFSLRAESLGNRAFIPGDLSITVSTTVVWMNTDSTSHTTTSNGPGWDSGIVAPGGRFSFAFQTAGNFPYHCVIHPGMSHVINH